MQKSEQAQNCRRIFAGNAGNSQRTVTHKPAPKLGQVKNRPAPVVFEWNAGLAQNRQKKDNRDQNITQKRPVFFQE